MYVPASKPVVSIDIFPSLTEEASFIGVSTPSTKISTVSGATEKLLNDTEISAISPIVALVVSEGSLISIAGAALGSSSILLLHETERLIKTLKNNRLKIFDKDTFFIITFLFSDLDLIVFHDFLDFVLAVGFDRETLCLGFACLPNYRQA